MQVSSFLLLAFIELTTVLIFSNLNVNGRMVRADVELWDSSGNHGFEASWPAIARDAHGVIFVFDPQKEDQVNKGNYITPRTMRHFLILFFVNFLVF